MNVNRYQKPIVSALFHLLMWSGDPTIGPLKDWTQLVAFDCAHWFDEALARNASLIDHGSTGSCFEQRVEQLPEVGSLKSLMVDDHFGMPIAGESVWVLFKPPYSTVNDWDVDAPEELLLSGLVRVEVVEILAKYERNAWLNVRVLELMRITDLIDRWLPQERNAPLPDLLDCGRVTCHVFGDFAYCTANADDCFQSVLCQQRMGRWQLLMHSDFGYHSDYLEVGVLELSNEESRNLGLPTVDA